VKIRDVIKMVEADGWLYHSQTGSHRQFVHPTKKRRVTVAGHPSVDLNPKTLAEICRQAQIPKPRR
jgi:predicted RNA binding protein YcfA (HicA-like mRNA interferase family)